MAIFDRLFTTKEKPLELDNPYEYPYEDCLSCRVYSAAALGGLGIYTYRSGMKQLRQRQNIIERSKSKYKTGSRQLGIVTLSASLVGLGLYRLVN